MQWQEWTPETGDVKITARRQDKLIDAIQQSISFVVRGQGPFPLDMLRYDKCWPATETDSITAGSETLMRTVKLRGLKVPTLDRWKSFGWEVTK